MTKHANIFSQFILTESEMSFLLILSHREYECIVVKLSSLAKDSEVTSDEAGAIL